MPNFSLRIVRSNRSNITSWAFDIIEMVLYMRILVAREIKCISICFRSLKYHLLAFIIHHRPQWLNLSGTQAYKFRNTLECKIANFYLCFDLALTRWTNFHIFRFGLVYYQPWPLRTSLKVDKYTLHGYKEEKINENRILALFLPSRFDLWIKEKTILVNMFAN